MPLVPVAAGFYAAAVAVLAPDSLLAFFFAFFVASTLVALSSPHLAALSDAAVVALAAWVAAQLALLLLPALVGLEPVVFVGVVSLAGSVVFFVFAVVSAVSAPWLVPLVGFVFVGWIAVQVLVLLATLPPGMASAPLVHLALFLFGALGVILAFARADS